MSDEADMARRAEEAERNAVIEQSRIPLHRQGSEFCVDCGDEILQARRLAIPSAERCLFCQTQFEGVGR